MPTAATKKKHSKPIQRSLDPATPADATLAAGFITSTGKPLGAPLSSTATVTLANPALQAKVLAVGPQLSVFAGCDDLQGLFDTANEAEGLLGAYDRLINSAGRVRQRYVQLNQRLIQGQSALLMAKKNATPSGPVAKALAGLAGLRKGETAKVKAKTHTTKKAKKAAAQANGTAAKA
jgi:hypothetical protein